MPIYAYRCDDCGFAQDVLQKMSDPLLVVCPSCGHSTFKKQVTAAGFQLKGSGWYVTDFRNPATKEAKPSAEADASKGTAPDPADSKADSPKSDSPSSEGASEAKPAAKDRTASESSAPAPTPKPQPAADGKSA